MRLFNKFTRMVPISEAMFDPTLPAKIRHNMEEENSNKMTSRVANPTQRKPGITGRYHILLHLYGNHIEYVFSDSNDDGDRVYS